MTERVFRKSSPKGPELANPLSKADEAVKAYERELETLENMKSVFKKSYPEAYQSLQDIFMQEDRVQERIKEAHVFVQEAKETVGDFKCVRKWKSAGYDPAEFVTLLSRFDKAGELVDDMVKTGVVEKIVLSDRASEFFSMHPAYSSHFESAWRDKKEATPAVSIPKVGVGF